MNFRCIEDIFKAGRPLVDKPIVAKKPIEAFKEFIQSTDLCIHKYYNIEDHYSGANVSFGLYFNRIRGIFRKLCELPLLRKFTHDEIGYLDLGGEIAYFKKAAQYKNRYDVLIISPNRLLKPETLVYLQKIAADFTSRTGIQCSLIEDLYSLLK